MHPAPSVILFTTFSGLGFGLLFWLGINPNPPAGWVAFVFFAIAYLGAVGGLLASTFHLGHPERALKAFSQWKTSWLSREGICAVATLLIMALYGAGLVFFGAHWAPLGWLGALGALATVFTTSMIYAQLKTVPRWKHWTTPALFLLLSLGGGALLAGNVRFALPLLIIAGVLQAFAWFHGDGRFAASGTTMETATGLGHIGTVRAFEPPHTGTNYLMKEFIHVVGRKHALQLRVIALVLGFVVPVLMLLMTFHHWNALVAVVSHIAGVLALRWLFFAQAEHVVGLYYGKR
ncbi:MAG: dimethyl sulfoxide reductase anchor subunit [Loktanella sp.]|mgnify:FL=1|jgi:DMSO reductase anchor subunit|nr:dimethyl sulfoxide reductase anchor subunit [Loktanella sp.]MDO7607404.1 dimethyl sulfoxide reductase anchor subunit [Loktanella sp.]MDO7623062.1 dimethyl sulfoxide reductase anchor subunit [Loktanella sp.]MDO7625446.1 dimethyl sulfoxide reductase anchor subunit [Loktanella sp.]MDO7629356.1 dimethyl sulfoxide reductase anchor subunit [Loktanella sp.]